MAITFVDISPGDNTYYPAGITSLGCGRPTVALNDIMLVSFVINSGSSGNIPGWSSPSGWTTLFDQHITAGGTDYHWVVEWKRASSSEPSSYTWTWSSTAGATYGDVVMAVYRGCNTGTVIDVTTLGTATSNTSHVAPSVTPTYTNDMLVVIAVEDNYSHWTPASGFTERYDSPYLDHGSMFADKLLSSDVATGTATFTSGSSGGGQAASILLIDADPTVNAKITGTPVVNTTHGNGSQAVTIPADCTAVVVFSWGWRNNTALDFTALNWDGGGLDFTLIDTNKSSSDPYDVWAYIMTANSGSWPGTGSKTLHWTFNAAPTEGGTVVIVFLKNVNGASPVVDSDYQKGGAFTSSMAGVGVHDLSFVAAANYVGNGVDAELGSQTRLTDGSNDNSVDWEIGYELGESAMQADALFDDTYIGYVAFAIAAGTAGGGGSTINLAATAAGASATPDAALAVAREFAAASSATSATPTPALSIARSLAAVVTAVSATPNITLKISGLVQLVASVAGTSATPDAALAVDRELASVIAGVSATPAPSLAITRALATTTTATSVTPTLVLTAARALVAAVTASSVTPDITLKIAGLIELVASVIGVSVTADAAVAVVRDLTSAATAASSTPAPLLSITRPLVVATAATSTTPDAALSIARALSAVPTAISVTPDITLKIAGLIELVASVTGISVVPDAALAVVRDLAAATTAVSATPDSALAIARPLATAATAASTTPSLPLSIARALAAAATAVSSTPDISLKIAGLVQLVASVTGVSVTSDAALVIARDLAATVTAVSSTPDAVLDMARALVAGIAAVSSTPDAAVAVARDLVSAVTAVSVVPDITLKVSGLIELVASVAGVSVTPDATLAVIRGLGVSVQAVSSTPATTPLNVLRALSAHPAGVSGSGGSLVVSRPLQAAGNAQSVTPDIDLVVAVIVGLVSVAWAAKAPAVAWGASAPSVSFSSSQPGITFTGE